MKQKRIQHEFVKLPNGVVIKKIVPSKKIMNNFRIEALNNRTKAELWAEKILLEHFKKGSFTPEKTFHYRRFDFFFKTQRVALEIDGGYHSEKDQKMMDISVDKILFERYKVIVLRVKNFDLVGLLSAIEEIKKLNHRELKSKQFLRFIDKTKKKTKVRRQKREQLKKMLAVKEKFSSQVILRKSSMNKIVELFA